MDVVRLRMEERIWRNRRQMTGESEIMAMTLTSQDQTIKGRMAWYSVQR